jgi:hypothetical protein
MSLCFEKKKLLINKNAYVVGGGAGFSIPIVGISNIDVFNA